MKSKEDIVTKLVGEVIDYTNLGLSKAQALTVVKESTCASAVAWKEVIDRVNYCL